MLAIRINTAIDIGQSMKQQLHSLINQIGELEYTINQINGLSGMDGVLMGLRREKERLEQSRRILSRMVQCIEKAILYYNSCEDRICDYAQQEAIVYTRHIIGMSDLGSIYDMLESVVNYN